MTITTNPTLAAETSNPGPAVTEPRTWLTATPNTLLGAVLHTEVGHHSACYGRRTAIAAAVSLPIGAGADLAYTAGTQLNHGGVDAVLASWAHLSPALVAPALLASLLVCVAITIGGHLLFHRDEAPYAGNTLGATDPRP